MDWLVEETGPTVATIKYKKRPGKGWERWVLLSADRHHDNPHSDQAMEKRHLDQAKERGAAIIDVGDLFCAMQGRGDRRGRKGDTREEDSVPDYLGAMVRSATNFYAPYAENFAVLGVGNHETSAIQHYHFDLTQALVDRLRDKGSRAIRGGYRGWVRFQFNNGKHFNKTLRLYFSHGAGGGGPVTKGVIGTNRRAVWLPDADLVVGGHIHEAWMLEMCRCRLNKDGVEYVDDQTHLCIPTYKQEFTVKEGYHVENERPPKPLGAWWLRFFQDGHNGPIKFECTRAK